MQDEDIDNESLPERDYVPGPFVALFELLWLVLLVYSILIYMHKIAFTKAMWLVGERVASMGGTGLMIASWTCFVCFVGLQNGMRWARWMAVVLLACIGFEQIPAISAAVMEFRWLRLLGHGVILMYAVLMIHEFWPKPRMNEKPLGL